MKVHEPARPAAVDRRKAVARNSGSGFTLPSDQPGAASAATPGAPLAAPGSVLALQEVGDALDGRRRAAARGHDMLDELERLKLGALDDRIPEDVLRRISAMVESAGHGVDDRRLADVIRDIEVRAAVEVAKHRRRESS